jgi:hypothetical protein
MGGSQDRHGERRRRPRERAWGLAAVVCGLLLWSWPGGRLAGRPAEPAQTASPTPSPLPWLPGGSWRAVHGPRKDPLWATDPPTLRAVHGITRADGRWIGWAVGDRGALVAYDGSSWAVVDTLHPTRTSPRTYDLRDVFVVTLEDVWLVGQVLGDRGCESCGFLLHYDGQRWRPLDRTELGINGRVAPLNAIDLIQDDAGAWTGWVVGDDADFDNNKAVVLHFEDGRWSLDRTTTHIAVNLNDVHAVSATEAWVVGNGGLESWYAPKPNGTPRWESLGRSGADNLYAVDLADPLYGWDGGIRGRMNYYTGQCHDDTLATQCWFNNHHIPLQMPSGQLINVDVYHIDVLSRREGWLVGAPFSRTSIVARLDAAAARWVTVPVQDDPGKALYGLVMVGSARGFAVGAEGVILEYVDEIAPTPTATPTAPASASATASPSPVATPSATPSPTVDSAPTATPTQPPGSPPASTTPSPTATPPPTATLTPYPTASSTPDAAPTPVSGDPRLYLPRAVKRR